MAESINLKKRLVGKEDIDFDITGTNETYNFFTADGGQKKLSKINASHFPLTREAREKLNSVNVDEALQVLSDKIENFKASDALSENVTVNFLPEDDAETIQNKINQQKKNLNGFTLTFVFPASLAQNLYSALVWKDFYNGTVVISGEAKNSKIAIYDRQNITSLFKVYRCLCEVRIEYFYFVHQYSEYAVSVESSLAVIIRDCNFSGMENADSYAVNKMVGNAVLIDCELSDDMEFYPPQEAEGDTGVGKSIGEFFAYPAATPPAGAYLLNGQTIYGCDELYPKFWEWVTTSGVRIIDNDTYEAELASAGVCGGFVVSSSTGSVRLPTWKGYQTPLGNSVPVVGNGMTLGLTDGTNNGGIQSMKYSNSVTRPGEIQLWNNNYGVNVGSTGLGDSTGGGFDSELTLGITTDSTKSGVIADTSKYPKDPLSWCIQVYNSATDLSEQESAQLASQMQMKAQTDLGNVTNPAQAFREMSISWGMPDYSAGVAKSSGTEYIAEVDGWLEIRTDDYNTRSYLEINGAKREISGSEANNLTGIFCIIPMPKNEKYKVTLGRTTSPTLTNFYPCKGGN